MVRRFLACLACVTVISMCCPRAFAMDLEGMLGAAMDVFKAATLSDAELRNVAAAAKKEMDGKNKLAPPTDVQAIRLARIARGIRTEKVVRPDIKLYLTPDVNAFAMADGTIRVYAGLMKMMTDDEVRYVLGHEIGHVALGHTRGAVQAAYTTSAIRKGMAASGNGIAAALSQSELAAIAEKMAHARYSRSNEFDADQYAVRFMNQNRCDSGAAVTALRKLETILGDESDIFASHPAPGERARALEELRSTSAAEFTRGL